MHQLGGTSHDPRRHQDAGSLPHPHGSQESGCCASTKGAPPCSSTSLPLTLHLLRTQEAELAEQKAKEQATLALQEERERAEAAAEAKRAEEALAAAQAEAMAAEAAAAARLAAREAEERRMKEDQERAIAEENARCKVSPVVRFW